MSLRWDKAEFDKLINLLEGANSSVPSVIAQKLTPVVKKMMNDAFVAESDVYGNDWAELKKPRKYPKKLAGLKNHIQLNPIGSTISASSDKSYTGYHQTGTKKMPARPPLPYTDEIPIQQKQKVHKVVGDTLKKYFKIIGGGDVF